MYKTATWGSAGRESERYWCTVSGRSSVTVTLTRSRWITISSSLFFHFLNPRGQRALRSTSQQHATNPFSAHSNTDHPEGPGLWILH
ncbi:hypothetical protein M405DRAFT_889234 [Rhizopogon salebrosus TDB-379]|nr:hypothetical protein M405DRAFT_889234 [Rhizopogon salebrosus TDB-379]